MGIDIKRFIKTFGLYELCQGLGVTGRHLFSKKFTIMYPEEKTPKSVRFRGLHALRRYEDGTERCIACKLCEAVCPALAITIESTELPNGERRTSLYDIDLFKCIYCGFCEEACPVDAIVMTDIHEFHMEDPDTERVINKQQLLAIGDENEASIAANRKQDIPYHR
jgi:NADH-quinone oxidoreductase subunit I